MFQMIPCQSILINVCAPLDGQFKLTSKMSESPLVYERKSPIAAIPQPIADFQRLLVGFFAIFPFSVIERILAFSPMDKSLSVQMIQPGQYGARPAEISLRQGMHGYWHHAKAQRQDGISSCQ